MPDLNNLRDLTDIQRAILERLEREPAFTDVFYFTGGTLLKALGIVPRESNDLDFFTFPTIDERAYMSGIAWMKAMFEEVYGAGNVATTDRGFLLSKAGIRIECVYDAVHAIDRFVSFGRLKVSGLRDLAANKAAAFCVRDEIKDYIDLAFLTAKEGWQLTDLAAIAEEKFSMETIPEEKLLTEFLRKREMFSPCSPKIFLRDQKENAALVERQVDFLLQKTSLS